VIFTLAIVYAPLMRAGLRFAPALRFAGAHRLHALRPDDRRRFRRGQKCQQGFDSITQISAACNM